MDGGGGVYSMIVQLRGWFSCGLTEDSGMCMKNEFEIQLGSQHYRVQHPLRFQH